MDEELDIWPENLPEVKDIACLLKCGVCYEYVSAPVLTPCSHSFCSLCIRKWLVNKQVCPTCSCDLVESSLRRNSILESIVTLFSTLVKKLIKKNCKLKDIKSSHIPKSTHSNSKQVAHTPYSKEEVDSKRKPKGSLKTHEEDKNLKPVVSKTSGVTPTSPITSKTSTIQRVPCPVCSALILERGINEHLDRCLSGDFVRETRASSSCVAHKTNPPAASSSPSNNKSSNSNVLNSSPKLEPLKKLVYNLMSEPQLRKELKKYGLPTQGDRRTLQNRIQRFVVLYNAECDTTNPRSILEIRTQLLNEEKVLSSSAPSTIISKILKAGRTDPKTLETAQKEYLQKNKSQYSKLIAEIRDRSKNKPISKKNKSCEHETSTKVVEDSIQIDCSDDESSPLMNSISCGGEAPSSPKVDSDDEHFIFKTSRSVPSKRRFAASSDEDDATKGTGLSSPPTTEPRGKKKSISNKNWKKSKGSIDETQSIFEDNCAQDGRGSPVLTRKQSQRKQRFNHQNSCRGQKSSNHIPETSVQDNEEDSRSSASETLMSPTPDIFDDASVDSYIDITPGQRTNSQAEISQRSILEEGTRDLVSCSSPIADDSCTDFEDD